MTITFADVVHQSIHFSSDAPSEAVVLDLLENPWLQRLRDISQTANTRLVYMFSEHSRFGHCLGVAYLANMVMNRLARDHERVIAPYRTAVSAAALLHDIGHLAPGSHTAWKTWFPDRPDEHEEIAVRIIREDQALNTILHQYGPATADTVAKILDESSDLPAWTWQIISGGGWNVDRGNWCMVDSIMAGVSYGKYNIPALTESIVLTKDNHLALEENRLDAMMHFMVSRHAMYRQVYQHRVQLATDTLTAAVVKRARDLGGKIDFCDNAMQNALEAKSASDLTLKTIFNMRESWWRYHLSRWSEGNDAILSDLSLRILNRRLLKTVRVSSNDDSDKLYASAKAAVENAGFDSRYYLHHIEAANMHMGDSKQSMSVIMDDGRLISLAAADPLFDALLIDRGQKNRWLALPAEAKALLGRKR